MNFLKLFSSPSFRLLWTAVAFVSSGAWAAPLDWAGPKPADYLKCKNELMDELLPEHQSVYIVKVPGFPARFLFVTSSTVFKKDIAQPSQDDWNRAPRSFSADAHGDVQMTGTQLYKINTPYSGIGKPIYLHAGWERSYATKGDSISKNSGPRAFVNALDSVSEKPEFLKDFGTPQSLDNSIALGDDSNAIVIGDLKKKITQLKKDIAAHQRVMGSLKAYETCYAIPGLKETLEANADIFKGTAGLSGHEKPNQ